MIKTIAKAFQSLSTSDQILFGVALIILINPTIAMLAAVLVLAAFICKIAKVVIKENPEE